MKRNIVRALLLLLLSMGAVPLLWWWLAPPHPAMAMVVQRQQPLPQTEAVSTVRYPTDFLFVDSARTRYRQGLWLVVPAMGLSAPVQNGTEPAALELGPGLYRYAQLPSYGNPNVSIAGHRDVFGAPFLTIDKLGRNSALYLVWQGTVYCYRWEWTKTITADDWSVIRCNDFSSVTLTSCDPIGTTQRRIVAVGRLEWTAPYGKDFVFPEALPEQQTVTQ